MDRTKAELRQEITDIITPLVEAREAQNFHQPVQIRRSTLLKATLSRLNDRYQRLAQLEKRSFRDLVAEELGDIMNSRNYTGEWVGANSGYTFERGMEQKYLPL